MDPSIPRSVEQAELFSVPEVGMRIFIKPEERQSLRQIPIVRPEQFATPEIKFTASSLEIVEIGEKEDDLVKVNIGNESLPAQEVWVRISSLLESGLWKIDRRQGNPLEGERLKEIIGTGEVPLRHGDTKRKLLRAQRCS